MEEDRDAVQSALRKMSLSEFKRLEFKKGGEVNIPQAPKEPDERIDKMPGLRDKFNDLKAVQQAADAMASKLTVPDRDKVLAAVRSGATVEDVANARRILRENLQDRQLANTASDY